MACAVYCLVPHPEQLDDLVDRLTDAGVQTEDIAVVLRKADVLSSSATAEALRFAQTFWDLSLGSATLWWPLGMYGWPARSQADNDHTVIPLDLYKAGRR